MHRPERRRKRCFRAAQDIVRWTARHRTTVCQSGGCRESEELHILGHPLVDQRDLDHVSPVGLDGWTGELAVDDDHGPIHSIRCKVRARDCEFVPTCHTGLRYGAVAACSGVLYAGVRCWLKSDAIRGDFLPDTKLTRERSARPAFGSCSAPACALGIAVTSTPNARAAVCRAWVAYMWSFMVGT